MIHLFVLPHWMSAVVVEGVSLIALWKGDWRARLIALTQLVIALIPGKPCGTWACPELHVLMLEHLPQQIALLAVCLVCASRADRYWPLWASSFALLTVTTLLMGFLPGASIWTIASANVIWEFLLEATLLWGVWIQVRRRRPGQDLSGGGRMIHLFVIPPWLNYLLFGLVALVALWKGDWRVRLVAVANQLALWLSLGGCQTWACPQLTSIAARNLAINGAFLGICVACALRSTSYWTIAASSCALLFIVNDLAAMVPGASIWAIGSAALIWNYLLCAAILWGVRAASRDRQEAVATR